MWSVWVVDTITGAKRFPLMNGDAGMVSTFSWQRLLSAGAGGSLTLQVGEVPADLDLGDLLEPISNTVVLDWDGVVVFAGIIWEQDYDRDKGTFTVALDDLWSILARRFAVDKFAPHVEVTKQVHVGLSLGTLAKRAVTLGISSGPVPAAGLRITRPSDASGPTGTRTYWGYNLDWVTDVLADLMDEGLDIDFEPRWVGGELDWQMRVGEPLTGPGVDWHLSAPESGVTNLKYKRDARKVRNNTVAVGEGSEQDMKVRSNRNPTSPYPMVEGQGSYKSEKSVTRLAALANGDLVTYGSPSSQLSFDVRASGSPGLPDLRLGAQMRTYSVGDRVIPDGWQSRRLIGFSGSLGEKVSLQLQPAGVV